jgi:hypothetical protein
VSGLESLLDDVLGVTGAERCSDLRLAGDINWIEDEGKTV